MDAVTLERNTLSLSVPKYNAYKESGRETDREEISLKQKH